MRAKTLRFVAPHMVDTIEVDVPEPGPGQVLVRTRYSGISPGTELLAYRGEIDPALALDETIGPLGGTFAFPFRYGYSSVGVIERSEGGMSPGAFVFAFHPHQDVFVCDETDLVPVPTVDPRIATLFPLVETALQISLDAGSVTNEHVLVMGLGPVGVLASLLLHRAGAHVTGVDPSPTRRDLARELDIEAVPLTDLRDRAGGGVPLVIEVSGNPEALASSLSVLSHEGTVLVASWYGTKPVTLDLGSAFHRRRLTIRSTQVSTIPSDLSARWTFARRRAAAAELLTQLPLKRLATHEVPFARAADAFAALDRGDDGVMHVALSYPEA